MDAPDFLQPFSDITPRPVTWLQQHRLARGKLSLCDGDPGLGKSLITLDLCARITTGRPFPDGSPAVKPADVIILSGEDTADDTVWPRLRAMDADLNRVFRFNSEFFRQQGPFRLPTHSGKLDTALSKHDAAFVVIDPITVFFDSSIHIHNDASVRRALSPLAELAERHSCHITMLRHLNKSGHFSAIYRGGGSIALLAASRSAYLCAPHPDDPLRSVMAEIKNNLAPRQPSLTYRIKLHESGYPVIDWLGQSELTANQLLVAAGIKPSLPTPADRAIDFLRAFLEDGPRSTLDICEAGKEQGLSERTLQRVAKNNKIQFKTAWCNNRRLTFWYFDGQRLPPEIDPPDPDRDLVMAALDEVDRQFPPNPLALDDDHD